MAAVPRTIFHRWRFYLEKKSGQVAWAVIRRAWPARKPGCGLRALSEHAGGGAWRPRY